MKKLTNLELIEQLKKVIIELENREYYRGITVASGKPFGIEQRTFKKKTANELRFELNQQAREFVESKLDSYGEICGAYRHGSGNICLIPEFFIKNNRVTCVLRGSRTKNVRFVGRANCIPSDVFNEWIGKAIALARALEVPIPVEFLRAVQPTHYAVGQVVTFPKSSLNYMKFNYRVETVSVYNSVLTKLFDDGGKAEGEDLTGSQFDKGNLPIIDDTNAIYETEVN